MRKKKVLVWATDLLLGAGVEFLLANEADLKVIGIAAEGETGLLKAIERHQPWVAILDEDDFPKDDIIWGLLLTDYPDLRLILVSTEHNYVQIYQKRDLLLKKASDLAEIIRLF